MSNNDTAFTVSRLYENVSTESASIATSDSDQSSLFLK